MQAQIRQFGAGRQGRVWQRLLSCWPEGRGEG